MVPKEVPKLMRFKRFKRFKSIRICKINILVQPFHSRKSVSFSVGDSKLPQVDNPILWGCPCLETLWLCHTHSSLVLRSIEIILMGRGSVECNDGSDIEFWANEGGLKKGNEMK